MYSDIIDSIGFLKKSDPELAASMERELGRQMRNIELIASENYISPAVMAAMGSVLANKYAEGYIGHRYYGGCMYIDEVETLAIERAKRIFGCGFVNVQPHSGAQANLAAYFAFCNPGDTIMGMNLAEGGHLTHGSVVNLSGRYYNFVPYGLDPDTGRIDYERMYALAQEHRPKVIVSGASAYPRAIDFKKIREVCDCVGAVMMVDIAHIAGLVAAGCHESPVPYADIVTTTTHKTLRGPRGGMIMTNDPDKARAIDKAIFPGTQGGPLEHVIAAKAVCFGEALEPEFRTYQQNIVKNASALADALLENGIRLVSGGTDNHLMLLDLRGTGTTGKKLENDLDEVYITVNKNSVPNDPERPTVTSGIRVGTPAVTTRGFGPDEMRVIAGCVADTIRDPEGTADSIRERVNGLCSRFPLYR